MLKKFKLRNAFIDREIRILC